MAKLLESPETLDAIRAKAFYNAKRFGTYNKRSSFETGRNILTFSELCDNLKRKRPVIIEQ